MFPIGPAVLPCVSDQIFCPEDVMFALLCSPPSSIKHNLCAMKQILNVSTFNVIYSYIK